MPTSTRSTRRSSSATTRAARPAGDRRRRASCSRPATRPRRRRAHRDGRRPGPPARARTPIVVPPRMSRLLDASKAVFEVFDDTTPLVEGLSIDEAFLDVGGCGGSSGTPGEIAVRLRRAVLERVGLPITVGVARTKFLAKVASARGQARRPARRAARRRAGVPAPAAGRAALGRRAGHRRASCTTRDHAPSARWPRLAEAALVAMLGRAVGPPPPRARPQPRPAAGGGRAAARARSARSTRSAGAPTIAGGDRRRSSSALVDRVTRRMRRRRPRRADRRAAAALRRLHAGHPLAHAAAGRPRETAHDPRRGPAAAGDGRGR